MYQDIRNTKRSVENSRVLDIGILAHEIAAKEVFQLAGKEYNLEKIIERFPMDVIYEVQESVKGSVNFERLFSGQAIIAVEESFSVDLPQVAENFRLISKPDAMTYREVRGTPYMCVYEWKSGFTINASVDTEALVYAYATHKKYGLPVIFNRVNIRTGKIWSHEFTAQSIIDIEPMLISLMKKFKVDMESEFTPEFKPGSHCQYCPYIAKCDGRKYVNTLRHKYKAALWAKELAKKYEDEVKRAAAEVLATAVPENGEEGTEVLLPFLEGRYGAVANTTKSYQLGTRKIKKADIIKALKEADMLDAVIDNLDLKFDEDVANLLSGSFDIPMKEVVRTTIKLQEKEEE
jgi:hypothetical protein